MKTQLPGRANRVLCGLGALALLGAVTWSSRVEADAKNARSGKTPAQAIATTVALKSIAFSDLNGKVYSSADLQARKATVFLFISSQCPVCNVYMPRVNALAAEYAKQGVAMFAIYPDSHESLAEVTNDAKTRQLSIPVVRDAQCKLTDALGAKMTPEAVVVDGAGVVRYRGRIDDNSIATRVAPTRPCRCPDRPLSAASPSRILHNSRSAAPYAVTAKSATSLSLPTFRRIPATWLPFCAPNAKAATGRAKWGRLRSPITSRPKRGQPTSSATRRTARCRPGNPRPVMACTRTWPRIRFPKARRPFWRNGPMAARRWAKRSRPARARQVHGRLAVGDARRCFAARKSLPSQRGWRRRLPQLRREDQFPERCLAAGRGVPPGQPARVVHHVINYIDGNHVAEKMDGQDKDGEIGFTAMGGGGGPGFAATGAIGGWAPGNDPTELSTGVGTVLPKGANLVIQVHYHKDGKPETDLTKIGLYFQHGTIEKISHTEYLVDPGFKILAGEKRHKATASVEINEDSHFFTVTPHMHVLGREMKVWATLPNKTVIPLVWIKDWDFNWQMTYQFKTPVALPKGSELFMEAYFDNSTDNLRNPNRSHLRDVTWGEQTTDEMCIAFLNFTKDSEKLAIKSEPPLKQTASRK